MEVETDFGLGGGGGGGEGRQPNMQKYGEGDKEAEMLIGGDDGGHGQGGFTAIIFIFIAFIYLFNKCSV